MGADPSTRDDEGITPLMMCAKLGNLTGLKLLVDHGAAVSAVDNTGTTALMQVRIVVLLHANSRD